MNQTKWMQAVYQTHRSPEPGGTQITQVFSTAVSVERISLFGLC